MRILKLLLLFVGLLYLQTSFAAVKDTLTGTVSDSSTHLPIAGATVSIPDLKVIAITDTGGHYRFNNLPQGNYLLVIESISYKRQLRSITVNGNTIIDIEMHTSIVEESEVVVTGTSKATSVLRSPVPIITVNKQYLQQNLSTNIIDAIAKVPGVNALTTGPNVSKPFIRGLGYNRILTLFDGVRQEGQQWGDEHGIEVDDDAIERIEVIKGPASLTYGSDALAGVVNLIPTQPAPAGKMMGNISAQYQTNNGMFGGSAMLGATGINGFEWIARASHKQATNYQNKMDGRVYNTAFNETDANLYLGLHGSWGYSHLSLSLYDDLQEIPDGSRDSATGKFTQQITEDDAVRRIVPDDELSSYTITPLHQHVQHYRIYSTNRFSLGKGKLTINGGFQRSIRREYSHPEVPYQTVPGLFLQLNTYSYDVKYFAPEFNGWNLTVGANGMYQDNIVTNGTEFIIPSYNQFDIGPFAMLKKTFDKLDIAGGIRYDVRTFNNDALYTKPDAISSFDKPVYGIDTVGASNPFYKYHHTFSGFSGSIGATYNFSDQFAVKANISRGYRAPNISEISSNGVHPGTNIYQIGNADFKPEFSLQEDIGLTYSSQKLVINFSVFNNVISNYIFNQRLLSYTGNDSVIVAGNQTYQFQQGKAQLYGGELSIDIHPLKSLHFENSISAVYGLTKDIDPRLQSDSNKYLPFIPPLHGTSELRYDFECKRSNITNAFVKVQAAWYAAQDRVYLTDNTETPTPGYTLINAGIGAGFNNKQGKTIFNLSIFANNIFDVVYQDHLSRLKYMGIYNMGRNIGIKLNFPLSFKN
ncbi:TonB-dependent receptor [Ferruginibacter albus]|uniref:TonB-dependent receptor n=1 Tax=Ferruginibacter albus TaxID=2875540 RepID=UPI001CC8152D|nr:TonB-dependent receptor [Ferruginibacter albus]UAY52511.1 TonB-dependent receptor [Ferruginibacter albus]